MASTKSKEQIRYSPDGSVNIVWDVETDNPLRAPSQEDMDTLPVGPDLTPDEIDNLDD